MKVVVWRFNAEGRRVMGLVDFGRGKREVLVGGGEEGSGVREGGRRNFRKRIVPFVSWRRRF